MAQVHLQRLPEVRRLVAQAICGEQFEAAQLRLSAPELDLNGETLRSHMLLACFALIQIGISCAAIGRRRLQAGLP